MNRAVVYDAALVTGVVAAVYAFVKNSVPALFVMTAAGMTAAATASQRRTV